MESQHNNLSWRHVAGLLSVAAANLPMLNALSNGQDAPWQWVVFLGSLILLPLLCFTPGGPAEDVGVSPPQPSLTDSSPRGLWLPSSSILWPSFRPRPWQEILLASLVLGLGIFLRFYRWDSVPPGIWSDEMLAATNAIRLLEGKPGPLFGTLPLVPEWPTWVHTFNLYTWTAAALLKITGVGHFGVKTMSIVPGCVTLLAFYWLMREVGGPRLALLGSLLLSLSRWHLTQSRFEWDGAFAVACTTLGMAAALRALRTSRWHWMALAGILVGISQFSYLASRLVGVGFVLFFAITLLLGQARRQIRRKILVGGLIFGLSSAIAAGPVLVFTFTREGIAKSRIEQLRIDKKEEGGSSWQDNLKLYLDMFSGVGPPNGRQNIPHAPLLPRPLGHLAEVGAILSVVFLRRGLASPLSLALFGTGILAGALSSPGGGPNAHRVCIVLPAVYLWATWAVELSLAFMSALLTRLLHPRPGSRLAWGIVAMAGAAIFLVGGSNTRDYYVKFGQSRNLYRAVRAAEHLELAHYLQGKISTHQVLVDNFFKDQTLDILLYRPPFTAGESTRGGLADPPFKLVPVTGRSRLPHVDAGSPALWVVAPETVPALRELYPTLDWRIHQDRWKNDIFATVELSAEVRDRLDEALLSQAAQVTDAGVLLPGDLLGPGLIRVAYDATASRGLIGYWVDRPSGLAKLTEEPLNRFARVNTWYAFIHIDRAGTYEFSTNQQANPIQMWIGGEEVDFRRKEGSITLDPGVYPFVLKAEVDVYTRLTLSWSVSGEQREVIPGSRFTPRLPPELGGDAAVSQGNTDPESQPKTGDPRDE